MTLSSTSSNRSEKEKKSTEYPFFLTAPLLKGALFSFGEGIQSCNTNNIDRVIIKKKSGTFSITEYISSSQRKISPQNIV